jgi:V/A-type H+-transporting ATPase subunit I
MMFGDVGHGLIIAALGFFLRHRLQGYAPIVVAAGGASVLFGVLYGSVFGHETLIHPLWISPLSDPLLMLRMAMAWGVGFILLATTLTIYNRLREQRWLQALMDGKGVAGIALYAAMIWLLYGWITHGATSAGAVTLLLGSLLSVMAYRWTQIGGPVGEKMLTVLIEGFETVMSYVSGSLSFLRVAAFSLNHVALALAVFAIADTLQGVGQWVVIVLGNLFIIVLEGAIVAIQVMRLEYYEGFSRFFHGDGQEFAPLKRLRVRPSSSATTRADARHQAPGSPTAAL